MPFYAERHRCCVSRRSIKAAAAADRDGTNGGLVGARLTPPEEMAGTPEIAARDEWLGRWRARAVSSGPTV